MKMEKINSSLDNGAAVGRVDVVVIIVMMMLLMDDGEGDDLRCS